MIDRRTIGSTNIGQVKDNLVLAGSNLPKPDAQLFGHAWSNTDLHFAQGRFADANELIGGQDGAYVSVACENDDVIIGTDNFGFGKLYIYEDDSRWAVGRSLMGLAEYVRSCGWGLTRNYTQLQNWFLQGNTIIGGQLTSFETVFNEIRLLPFDLDLRICGKEFPRLERREPKFLDLSYRDSLQYALIEFCSRLKTLLSSELPVTSDITGGQDSRFILCGLQRAAGTDIPLGDRVRFKSQRTLREDFAVASEIADKFGLKLNRAPKEKFDIDPDLAIEKWVAHDLGVYSPIYPVLQDTQEVSLNGCVPAFRNSYNADSVKGELISKRTRWLSDDALEGLSRDAEMSLEMVANGGDDRINHYTEFRSRIHGGRPSLRGPAMSPLCMNSLYQTALLLPFNEINRSQFYADAMFSMNSRLAELHFDKPNKNWTETHLSALTQVEFGSEDLMTGKVNGTLPRPARSVGSDEFSQIERLADLYYSSRERATGLLPESYVAEGDRLMRDALERPKSLAPILGFVSMVILTGRVEQLVSN